MKSSYLLGTALGLLLQLCPARAENDKPNIIYILADDLGRKDVGFHGSDIKAPNIDKLAVNGARLEQFYVQPMCTPTRAALLTGRYPCRYGLQTIVIPSVSTYGLATDEWLLPQALKENGYQTAIIGKWHLGHGDKKYWPKQRGFDYQYGPLIGELDYFTHEEHGVVDWYRDNKLVNEKGYTTTLLGNDAVKYINERNAAIPFFLYLTFNAPHTPYQAPREYIDRYKSIEDPTRRTYAAMITCMDDDIGRVVEALDKKFDAKRLRTGRFDYRMMKAGKEISGKFTVTVEKTADGNFRFTGEATGFNENRESIATPVFHPVSATLRMQLRDGKTYSMTLKYGDSYVTGSEQKESSPANKIDNHVPPGTVDQRIDWAAAMSIGGEVGDKFRFTVFDPATGVSQVTGEVASRKLPFRRALSTRSASSTRSKNPEEPSATKFSLQKTCHA